MNFHYFTSGGDFRGTRPGGSDYIYSKVMRKNDLGWGAKIGKIMTGFKSKKNLVPLKSLHCHALYTHIEVP